MQEQDEPRATYLQAALPLHTSARRSSPEPLNVRGFVNLCMRYSKSRTGSRHKSGPGQKGNCRKENWSRLPACAFRAFDPLRGLHVTDFDDGWRGFAGAAGQDWLLAITAASPLARIFAQLKL